MSVRFFQFFMLYNRGVLFNIATIYLRVGVVSYSSFLVCNSERDFYEYFGQQHE